MCPAMVAIMSLVVANAISIGVRERRNEMAVLKVLGFQPRHVVALVLGEALLVGFLAGGMSAFISWYWFRVLKFQVAFFGAFFVPWQALIYGPLLGMGVALAGSIGPAWKARSVKVAEVLSDAEGVAAIELNISCPNIKEGGIQFGCSLNGTYDVVSAVKKATHLPVIPKLTPNVTSPSAFARAAEDAGADAISLVNTFLAMAIDVETRRPKLSNVMGGLSGPAIRPIAVRMVYECRREVKIPIIGMGGIMDARDALEFIIAGADAVQIGTANFVDPFVWGKVLDGIGDYMEKHGVARVADLVGTVDTSPAHSHA